jgi:hypothetical protein
MQVEYFIILPCTVPAVTAFSLFVVIVLTCKANVFDILAQRKNREYNDNANS